MFFIIASLLTACGDAATQRRDQWYVLTKAYPLRKDDTIRYHLDSPEPITRAYAKALSDLSARRFNKLVKDAVACQAIHPGSAAGDTAKFGCLFAASTGLGIADNFRAHALWLSKVKAYYTDHADLINRATGSSNPADVRNIQVPGVAHIKMWPNQQITVNKEWQAINLKDGYITGSVDGTKIKFLVDTGDSGGISLSRRDVERNGLAQDLRSLNYSMNQVDYSGGSTAEYYYVSYARVGPIKIRNAYVAVTDAQRSTVGMSVLSKLAAFTVTGHKIKRWGPRNTGFCGKMLFTRMGTTQAFSYPMVRVPSAIGKIGLVFDSGMRMSGSLRRVLVYLKPRYLEGAIQRHATKLVGGTFKQNGKEVKSVYAIGDMHINGELVTVTSLKMGMPDPWVTGAITGNALLRGQVSFDFKRRRMCFSLR
jgi:clan AA aspartic protease (TIGR02281 family)